MPADSPRQGLETTRTLQMSNTPASVTPVSASELIDAAARLVMGPNRELAIESLFSLVRAADLDAIRNEIRSDARLRAPEDWWLLDRCRREVDELLSTNPLCPFGTAKFLDQLRHLEPALKYIDVRGAEVMELGAGVFSPHVLAAYFYLNGARTCYAIDPNPVQNKGDAARALGAVLADASMQPDQWDMGVSPRIDFLARISNFDRAALIRGDIDAACRAVPIAVLDGDPAELVGKCKIDFLFSVAVLEHVMDFDKLFRDARRLLRPGAITAHVVDFSDHGFHAGWCEHRWGYLMLGGGDGRGPHHPINRIRLSAMVGLFEAHGLQTLEVQAHKLPVPAEVLDNLRPEYRNLSLDDLETYMATIVSRCT